MIRDRWIFLAIYLLALSIITRYAVMDMVVSSDQLGEYEVYLRYVATGAWEYIPDSLVNSALFVTLIPAWVQRLTGLDQELVFKVFPGLFYALMPAFVYLIARMHLDRRYAVLASALIMTDFFFIIYPTFGRVGVAYGLLATVVFCLLTRRLWFALATVFLLVFAHYGTLFLFGGVSVVMAAYYAVLWLRRRATRRVLVMYASVAFILVAGAIGWHGMVAQTPGAYARGFIFSAITMGDTPVRPWVEVTEPQENEYKTPPPASVAPASNPNAKSGIASLIDIETRDIPVQMMLFHLWDQMSVKAQAELVARYLVGFGMLIGAWFAIKGRYGPEWVIMTLAFIAFILSAVIVPRISSGYGIARLILMGSVLLAPLFVIGTRWVADRSRTSPFWLAFAVIGLYGSAIGGYLLGYLISLALLFYVVLEAVYNRVVVKGKSC